MKYKRNEILKIAKRYLFANEHFKEEYSFFRFIPSIFYVIINPVFNFICFYTWFRWIDNIIDETDIKKDEAMEFVENKKKFLSNLYIDIETISEDEQDELIKYIVIKDNKNNWNIKNKLIDILDYLIDDIEYRYKIDNNEHLTKRMIKIKSAIDITMIFLKIKRSMSDDIFDKFILAREMIYNILDLEDDIRNGFIYIPSEIFKNEIEVDNFLKQSSDCINIDYIQTWKNKQLDKSTETLNYILEEIKALPMKERMFFRFSIKRTLDKIVKQMIKKQDYQFNIF